jgi:putative flippase GtrA
VQTSGLLINLGLVYLFVDGLGLGKLSGQAVTIVIVTVLTFFANRAWTFRGHALVETVVDP